MFDEIRQVIKHEISIPYWTIIVGIIVPAISTFLIGWMLFGWVIAPVEWEPYKMNSIPIESKVVYVHLVSEWYAYSNNDDTLPLFVYEMNGIPEIACSLATQTEDFGQQARYMRLAWRINGIGCTPP